jgi:hypothetical protein
MEDFSWPVLTLGLEDGWPPPPVEAEAAAGGNGGGPDDPAAPKHHGGAASPSEDHDPTPSRQDPEDGHL